MKNETNHKFLTELESMPDLNYKVDCQSVLLDLKVLLKDYYAATFSDDGENLQILFNNGQKFLLSVKEVK